MHNFDLNLDWVAEVEEARNLSPEALGSSDEELNGFIDYFLHGSDSDVSQSDQAHILEESISRNRFIISRNEGMDLDFVELGLGFGLDSDTNDEAPFDLNVTVNESGESSSSSSMRELELVCEEDFRVLVNESNANNQAPEMVVQDVENESNEIQFDYSDGMMVDTPDEVFTNYNDEVDGEEGIGMNINAADEYDGDDRLFNGPDDRLFNDLLVPWNNVHNEIVEDVQYFEGSDDDDEDGMFFSWVWNNSNPEIVEAELEQLWGEFWPEWDTWDDDSNIFWNMQTVKCDVDNLPSVTLTQEELNKNNSICAICMENFSIEEKLKRLPCFHYYHVDCISPWLRTRNTCPTCRYELPII